MEIILKLIEDFFKRKRWAYWLFIAVVLITFFYFPNTYHKTTSRVSSAIMNLIVREAEKEGEIMSWVVNDEILPIIKDMTP